MAKSKQQQCRRRVYTSSGSVYTTTRKGIWINPGHNKILSILVVAHIVTLKMDDAVETNSESAQKIASDYSSSYMESSSRISYMPMPCKKLAVVFEDAADTLPPRSSIQRQNEALKVVLRLRPSDERYSSDESEPALQVLSDTAIKTVQPQQSSKGVKLWNANPSKQVTKQFTFSRVFEPSTTQQTFYEDAIKPVLSALSAGENVLLFSYGMTNSGKTHTILGDDSDPGAIPRLLDDIFSENSSFLKNIKFSCLEIYNELIHDLLRTQKKGRKPNLKLQDCGGRIDVKGLESFGISNVEEAMGYLKLASDNRKTAGTNMNSASSRSHCVNIFELTNTRNDRPVILWVVDLAGSERGGRTGVSSMGARQKEASNINTSLMKLWRCLNQMRRSKVPRNGSEGHTQFVPFRESKLTHLLMNHLSGACTGKTMMIVNASMATADYDETQHVLEHSAIAQEVTVVKNEAKSSKLVAKSRADKQPSQYDQNGRKIKKRKAEKSIESVAAPDNVLLEAEDAKSISLQSENLTLRKSIEAMRSKMVKQEAMIRMEVAKEMADRMSEMQAHWSHPPYGAESASQQSACMSSRKLKVGALQSYIHELEDKNQECEEELARMQRFYEEKLRALNGGSVQIKDSDVVESSQEHGQRQAVAQGELYRQLEAASAENQLLKEQIQELLEGKELQLCSLCFKRRKVDGADARNGATIAAGSTNSNRKKADQNVLARMINIISSSCDAKKKGAANHTRMPLSPLNKINTQAQNKELRNGSSQKDEPNAKVVACIDGKENLRLVHNEGSDGSTKRNGGRNLRSSLRLRANSCTRMEISS